MQFTKKIDFNMEQMNDLKALLCHDVQLLHSAEMQIIEAMPAMIEKAQSPAVKQALTQHMQVTEKQRARLNQIRDMLDINEDSVSKYTGVLANLMGGSTTCKGMEGLIDEGQKVMAENLSPEVMDAAIVAGNQKIEHYEIACYGTARTYAEQLGLTDVARLLQETLDEEYYADKILTNIATGGVNQMAELGSEDGMR
jgi:ferritin-like metal-binding protein YciE